MTKYDSGKIEKKWQKYWKEHPELDEASEKSDKPKKYVLDMFPYPSGAGLHAGHVESYTATDIYSRFLRLKGFNVIHPQGWDAFGLPAENYAIKTGVHPSKTTKEAIATFKRQMSSLGLSYDWSREVNSSDSEYYKWTQWFFLFLYQNGLAYKKKSNVNWCESCQTVLANEQAEGGVCERCKNEVVQKDLEQWFFKITDFIETKDKTTGLLDGLDKIDWPESTKAAQKNWIGKSEGATIKFPISNFQFPINSQKPNDQRFVEVFTTRVDTIFGCTYLVIAPEHPILKSKELEINNQGEVDEYILKSKSKTDLERMELKEKSGVELKGVKAINPFNNQAVPVFVADYVLGHYGTGAVMAVPAHDERDFEFAKKYDLPIVQSVAPYHLDQDNPPQEGKENTVRRVVHVALENEKGEFLTLHLKGEKWGSNRPKTLIVGGIEGDEKPEMAALREIEEETGYTDIEVVKVYPIEVHAEFYAAHKELNRYVKTVGVICKLKSEKQNTISEEERALHDLVWVKREALPGSVTIPDDIFLAKAILESRDSFTDDGVVVDSGEYDGLTSEEAREKMTEWLEKNNLGSRKINYRMRDWLVSRQRYWGAPIPIIYCEKCGEVPVPESDLPVILPMIKDFTPKGKSPLAADEDFMNVQCPKCGGAAKRESDTMDTFVCSSWYYLRYADPKNDREFASKSQIEKWLPVDLYLGGAEHTVLHLLYSRFFTKALSRFGYINFDEPFLKLRHQGIILGEDGRKMSKSFGNVVNPDDYVKEFGADSLRMYEMFMGPLEAMKPWSSQGIIGVKRFLEKVWRLSEAVLEKETGKPSCLHNTHKVIKKVTEDIESFKFNTAVSALMEYVNYLDTAQREKNTVDKNVISILAKMISPLAPHLAEELWFKLGNEKSIFLEKWPKYDPQLIQDEEVTIAVQINGKLRDTLKVPADISEEDMKKLAMESEKVKNFLASKEIKKVIFVKGRLISFVIN